MKKAPTNHHIWENFMKRLVNSEFEINYESLPSRLALLSIWYYRQTITYILKQKLDRLDVCIQ